jgi:hypothetical protein
LTGQSKKRLNPENFSHRHITPELHECRCRLTTKLSDAAMVLTLLWLLAALYLSALSEFIGGV